MKGISYYSNSLVYGKPVLNNQYIVSMITIG